LFRLLSFVMDADLIFQLLRKDATLTGRTLAWPYVIDNISEKPVLGREYYGFWSSLNSFTYQIADATGIGLVANSHNTILEMSLGIRFVGTSFFIFLWVRNFVLAVKCMHGPGGQFGVSSVLLLIGILLIGMDEVVLLSPGQIWTSPFFAMGLICEKKLWLAHAARTQGRLRPRSTLTVAATSRSYSRLR
jgi:exopolysaccharide production protein ExoQ